jgi:glutamate--cysteine ligase
MLAALPAFWVGLLYDEAALGAAWDLVKDWTAAERQQLRNDVPKLALRAAVRGRAVRDIATDCLAIARRGLSCRARLDIGGRDETRYLDTLDDIVARGVTPAETLMEKFNGEWRGSIEPAFTELAY